MRTTARQKTEEKLEEETTQTIPRPRTIKEIKEAEKQSRKTTLARVFDLFDWPANQKQKHPKQGEPYLTTRDVDLALRWKNSLRARTASRIKTVCYWVDDLGPRIDIHDQTFGEFAGYVSLSAKQEVLQGFDDFIVMIRKRDFASAAMRAFSLRAAVAALCTEEEDNEQRDTSNG